MSYKEPGQFAFEASPSWMTWEQQPATAKAFWAMTEAVVRRAALEEAAKVADESATLFRGDYEGVWTSAAESIAKTIRALGGRT